MNNGGIGVVGLLGIVFVILKLVGIINWSWWFVLLPFYGPISLVLVIFIVAFITALVVGTK